MEAIFLFLTHALVHVPLSEMLINHFSKVEDFFFLNKKKNPDM